MSEEIEDTKIDVKILAAGDAVNFPKDGATVCIHYEAKLEDGTVFDSTRGRKREFHVRIGMGSMIKGLEMAIPNMSVGEIARVKIPYKLAYGVTGYPPIIPTKANLEYEVELLAFKNPE